jgi:hypothetical protein
MDKFTQMAIEYPELVDQNKKIAQNDVNSKTQNTHGKS